MAKIPTMNTMNNAFISLPDIEEKTRREYLGMSSLGSDCERKVWLGFRFASRKIIPYRIKLIFDRGHWEEHRIIRDLKKLGLRVFRRNEKSEEIEIFGTDGEKQEQIIGFAGHAKGHLDGRCVGVLEAPKTEHLLEMKSMNDARFKAWQNKGVKESDPVYYSQTQRYMDKSKLTRTLFAVRNKNNEDLKFERIRFDKPHADMLAKKEQDIITSDVPFGQKFSRTWFACKGCSHYDVCHNDAAPVKTCRSCEHVDLALEGKWLCAMNKDKELSLADQLKACPSYRRLF